MFIWSYVVIWKSTSLTFNWKIILKIIYSFPNSAALRRTPTPKICPCAHQCVCSYIEVQYIKFEILNRDVTDFLLQQISFYMSWHAQKWYLHLWNISSTLKNCHVNVLQIIVGQGEGAQGSDPPSSKILGPIRIFKTYPLPSKNSLPSYDQDAMKFAT